MSGMRRRMFGIRRWVLRCWVVIVLCLCRTRFFLFVRWSFSFVLFRFVSFRLGVVVLF